VGGRSEACRVRCAGDRWGSRANGRLVVTLRGTLAGALALVVTVCASSHAAPPVVDMAEVRRLAREPVETILEGAPVGRVSDEDYRKAVNDSPRPVVVIFYANHDEKSRHLATLARYLALEFSQVITFYGYRVTAGAKVERETLGMLQKRYGVKQVPATLFYDNDRGKIELEKTDYSVPTLVEYRTPSLLFWKTYHQAIRDYIQKSILD
jgi:Thioredoxin